MEQTGHARLKASDHSGGRNDQFAGDDHANQQRDAQPNGEATLKTSEQNGLAGQSAGQPEEAIRQDAADVVGHPSGHETDRTAGQMRQGQGEGSTHSRAVETSDQAENEGSPAIHRASERERSPVCESFFDAAATPAPIITLWSRK